LELSQVEISVPEGCQLVLGQSHFIKTVEDLYETLATAVPGLKFGVAFCESSGKALIRHDGTDEGASKLAVEYAQRLSCGHSFVVILREAFPINVLNRIKSLEEVANVYCATANKVTVIVAEADDGRGILGVIDGVKSRGVETSEDKEERRAFLRKIGYKR
jgi:adenosine/AMP kinase